MRIPNLRVTPTRLCFTFLLPLAMLAAVAWFSARNGHSVGTWVRDPTSVAGVHPLTGFVSNVGVLLWCATAAVCFHTAAVLHVFGKREAIGFFAASGLLSGYLMADDLFQFHEKLAYRYFGIAEHFMYVLIAIVALCYFWRYRSRILSKSCGLLVIAVVLLAVSVCTDLILGDHAQRHVHWWFLLEDGSKVLGIAAWCSYYMGAATDALAEAVDVPLDGV